MRILVGIPCATETCQVDFTISLANACRAVKDHDLDIVVGKSSIVTSARNICVENALKHGYDRIMLFDNDMSFPPGTITRLLEHDKDIVGCVYRRRYHPFELMGFAVETDKDHSGGLAEMKYLPLGVCMIKTSIFEKFSPPYFRIAYDETRGVTVSEDYLFCIEARERGLSLWVDIDLSMEIGHISQRVLWTNEATVSKITKEAPIKEGSVYARAV